MKEVKQPKKPILFYYVLVLIVLLVLNSLVFPRFLKQQITEVDYGTFLSMLDKKEVTKAQVEKDYIYFIDNAEKPAFYMTATFDDAKLVDRLYEAGCSFGEVKEKEPSPIISFLATWVLPIFIFIVIGQVLSRLLMKKMGNMGGMPTMQFGKSNAKVYVGKRCIKGNCGFFA